MLLSSCQGTPNKAQTKCNNGLLVPAEFPDPKIGYVAPEVIYDSNKTLVFRDFFGIVIYSLEKEEIVASYNLKAIGYDRIQGDGATFVAYDEKSNVLRLCRSGETQNDPDRFIEIDVSANNAKPISKEEYEKITEDKETGELEVAAEAKDWIYKSKDGKVYKPLEKFKEYLDKIKESK